MWLSSLSLTKDIQSFHNLIYIFCLLLPLHKVNPISPLVSRNQKEKNCSWKHNAITHATCSKQYIVLALQLSLSQNIAFVITCRIWIPHSQHNRRLPKACQMLWRYSSWWKGCLQTTNWQITEQSWDRRSEAARQGLWNFPSIKVGFKGYDQMIIYSVVSMLLISSVPKWLDQKSHPFPASLHDCPFRLLLRCNHEAASGAAGFLIWFLFPLPLFPVCLMPRCYGGWCVCV